MKKSLVVTLVLIFVLGIAGSAFAANLNKFDDVPKTHWSYAAIKKLADAGIIDGANGNFNGDKTLTRYEMAEIVANALTKEEKADAETKALIEKLAAEYKADLENIGIRLKTVEEEKADKIEVHGYFGFRYQDMTLGSIDLKARAANLDLVTTYKLDDQTTLGYESSPLKKWKSNSVAGDDSTTYAMSLYQNYWAKTQLSKATTVTIGKFGIRPGYGMAYFDQVTGIQLTTQADKAKYTLNYGEANYGVLNREFGTDGTSEYDYYTYNAINGFATIGVDYALTPSTNVKAAYLHLPSSEYYDFGFDTKIAGDFTLNVAGAKSDAPGDNNSYLAQVKYKDAVFYAIPGSWDVFANYRKVPTNATICGRGGNISDFYGDDNFGAGFEGSTVGFHYVPKKMVMLTVYGMNGHVVDSHSTERKVFRTQLDFFL